MDPVYLISELGVDLFDCFSKITGNFEGNKGFANLSGNFDGQGISAGVLQWNLGQGSLQPVLSEMLETTGYSGLFAKEFAELAALNTYDAVQKSLEYQQSARLRADFKKAFTALLTDPQSVEIQKKYMRKIYNASSKLVNKFGFNADSLLPNLFFFDLVTNSGSMKTITPEKIDMFYQDADTLEAELSEISSFVESTGDYYNNTSDLFSNDGLSTLSEEQVKLLIIAYERANLSNPTWKLVAFARRAAIAMNQGYVNKELIKITDLLGIE